MIKTFAAALISTCALVRAGNKAAEIEGIMRGEANFGYKKTGSGAEQVMQVQTILSMETIGDNEIIDAAANFFTFACFRSFL